MTTDLLGFSSLENLLGLGVSPEANKPTQPTPTLPMPGIGAPMDAAETYADFEGGQVQQQIRPPVRALPMAQSTDQIDLLREKLKEVESSGNYQAKNPRTSASGAYQYINSTWGGYGGYAEARLAPRKVQDARATEDLVKSLRRFNGDPFRVIANHMLPAQANKPWLWTQPSTFRTKKGVVTIPPVIDYVRKVVKGTPYENQLNTYMAAYLPTRR